MSAGGSVSTTSSGLHPEEWGHRYPAVMSFVASGASVATGVILTNWVDVIKVRQQQAGASSRNLLMTGAQIVRHEGLLALYKGVTAAVVRGVLYGGLRIGLYDPIKHVLGANSAESSLTRKVAAGMLSGSLAAGVCNPTDLVKTRMQAKGAALRNPFAVVGAVVRETGVAGLWTGTTPSMARAALLTAAQCATYDEVKLLFVRNLGWEDTVGTHFAVSTLAGLVTSAVISPVDMVKTTMFIKSSYTGPLHCTMHIMRTQGVRGFFKGFAANWARQGPMTTVIFVTLEALKQEFGLDEA